jgi:hypothetical protein
MYVMMSKKELLEILETCINDHEENLQYADKYEDDDEDGGEYEWRKKCIDVLKYTINKMNEILDDDINITISIE